MSPLTNAVLGMLFLGAGSLATVLMYHLRGTSPGIHGDGKTRPSNDKDRDPAKKDDQRASWQRATDSLETYMADIHTMADTGKSIIESMRTRKPTFSWDDLLIRGAQLAKLPLNEDEPVGTQTVIGPAARNPLVLDTPLFVSHMSFGALSREAKIALARGSAAVGTAICSGEGGILEDELQAAGKYIFEYVPNQYSVTDENLQRVDAIEIKIGQSAKPGMGGLLPGGKVTDEIAALRGRPEGASIASPARFPDIQTQDDLKRVVSSLRERSDGKPIGIKLAAGDLAADLTFALAAEPDFVTVDGRAGATGAAPKFIKDAASVPSLFALYRARQILDEQKADRVSLIITGGLRISADFAKALALGADAVAMATSALIAGGCQQYRICESGRCPAGVTTQDPELRSRLNVDQSARGVENFLRVSTRELSTFARLTGNNDVHGLSLRDIFTTNSEVSSHTTIAHA